jgi:hypothetical protein
MGVCNQITLLIHYYNSWRLVTFVKINDVPIQVFLFLSQQARGFPWLFQIIISVHGLRKKGTHQGIRRTHERPVQQIRQLFTDYLAASVTYARKNIGIMTFS